MHKPTKLSRFWYNFKTDICFWFKLIIMSLTEKRDPEEVMKEMMEGDEKINKALGLPPLDAKNPYRFL